MSMLPPWIRREISSLHQLFEQEKKPLDLLLRNYFKDRPSLGARARRDIGDTLYQIVRWKPLLKLKAQNSNSQNLIDALATLPELQKNPNFPLALRLGVPEWLLQTLEERYGSSEAKKICSTLSESAPVTIRVNPLKTSRIDLLKKWEELYGAIPCKGAPYGIQFPKRLPLSSWPEFREGLFEIQDEGSQEVCDKIEVAPGNLVLDYCSGSGGKSLGIAHKMGGQGQLFLHDIRDFCLIQAKKRLKRAGIQNVQFLTQEHPALKKLKKRCDVVIVDVPCSGTGTLRRNPEQKWSLNQDVLNSLMITQREIVEKACLYLKAKATLYYITCSLLPKENEEQVQYFLEHLPLELDTTENLESFKTLLPVSSGRDGFFFAKFRLKEESFPDRKSPSLLNSPEL